MTIKLSLNCEDQESSKIPLEIGEIFLAQAKRTIVQGYVKNKNKNPLLRKGTKIHLLVHSGFKGVYEQVQVDHDDK